MADKALIVDDEPDILTGIEDALVEEGYEVITARNGKDGLRKAAECVPDLIILDVMMPGMDGYEVCEALRQRGIQTPIIMLTARDTEDDKVRGLDTGADDYITKPFSMRELVARIKAIRRRQPGVRDQIREFSFAGMHVDFDRQILTKKGRKIRLSSCESDLLRLLVARRGEAISRATILTEVWGYDFPPDTRTIDNHIVRLRQKIEDDPHHPRHLLTIHGKGYKFTQ